MKFKQSCAALAAAMSLMLPATSSATDLNYNYIDLGYVFKGDFKGTNGDGVRVRGSVEFAPDIIAVGELVSLGFNNGADIDLISIGAGYIYRHNQQFDAIGTAEIGRIRAKGPGGTASDSGFKLTGGVRAIVAPRVEAFGRLVYEDFNGSDVYLEGGAMYQLTQQISVGGAIQFGGDLDTFSVVGRYSF